MRSLAEGDEPPPYGWGLPPAAGFVNAIVGGGKTTLFVGLGLDPSRNVCLIESWLREQASIMCLESSISSRKSQVFSLPVFTTSMLVLANGKNATFPMTRRPDLVLFCPFPIVICYNRQSGNLWSLSTVSTASSAPREKRFSSFSC